MMDATTWIERANSMQILVVDDDEDMLRLMSATIRAAFGDSVRLDAVNDPSLANGILESNPIDVLITDLEMPGISGLQLMRFAKRRNAWTQVVVVTGHSTTDTLTDAMDRGASDYLVKPLDPVELEQSLSEASARLRRWRQSLARTLVPSGAR